MAKKIPKSYKMELRAYYVKSDGSKGGLVGDIDKKLHLSISEIVTRAINIYAEMVRICDDACPDPYKTVVYSTNETILRVKSKTEDGYTMTTVCEERHGREQRVRKFSLDEETIKNMRYLRYASGWKDALILTTALWWYKEAMYRGTTGGVWQVHTAQEMVELATLEAARSTRRSNKDLDEDLSDEQ